MVLKGSAGFLVKHALKFAFPVSKNMSEYEAIISSLGLAEARGVSDLKVHSDSQLVVNQIIGTFEAKDEVVAL